MKISAALALVRSSSAVVESAQKQLVEAFEERKTYGSFCNVTVVNLTVVNLNLWSIGYGP